MQIRARAAQVRQSVATQIADERARQKINDAAALKKRMDRLAASRVAAEKRTAAANRKKTAGDVASAKRTKRYRI